MISHDEIEAKAKEFEIHIANLERLNTNEFVRLNNNERPVNNSVTIYRANPHRNLDEELTLEAYNMNLLFPHQ